MSDARPDIEIFDIGVLLAADSPRLSGENREHIRMLAESEDELPPILVDRRTMRVVDGMHRLRAAALRGAVRIKARFFEGTSEAAFLAAVRENVTHGLPLSRADREAAVVRILGSFPELSDRAVGSACGVSHSTVGTIRRRATVERGQLHRRIGLDGRVRPLSSAEGRRLAQQVIFERPDASLREIAKLAGISPNTVKDVRDRMRRGEDPLPPQQSHSREADVATLGATANCDAIDVHRALLNMKRDPSLRFTDAGRRLLRWLDAQAANLENWQDLVEVVPAYHVGSLVSLARRSAQMWEAFAARLDAHGSAEVERPAGTV